MARTDRLKHSLTTFSRYLSKGSAGALTGGKRKAPLKGRYIHTPEYIPTLPFPMASLSGQINEHSSSTHSNDYIRFFSSRFVSSCFVAEDIFRSKAQLKMIESVL